MTDFSVHERTVRRQAVLIRAVTILIISLIAVYVFKRNDSGLMNNIGAQTYRSVAEIIAFSLIADLIICAGDYFKVKIYILHFVLNSIVSLITGLTVAAIAGILPAVLLFIALQIPFFYHSLRNKKITNQAVAELNEAIVKYNNEAKEKAEKDSASRKEK